MNEAQKNSVVDEYIATLTPEIKEIVETWREKILNLSPNIHEEWKWSMPNYSIKEIGLVSYLQIAKGHVNLGFNNGYELIEFDVNNYLNGSGKNMRHIELRADEKLDTDAIILLLRKAFAL